MADHQQPSRAAFPAGGIDCDAAFRALLDGSQLALIAYGPDGSVLEWNRGAERIFGWTRDEVLGRPAPHLDAEARAAFEHERSRAAGGEAFPMHQVKRQRRDGRELDVIVSYTPLQREGEVIGVLAVVEDISDRTAAELQVRESEERYRRLAEASFEGIALHEGGHLFDVNDSFASLFGYQREEMIGMDGMEVVAPEDRHRVREVLAARSEHPYEVQGLRRDGTRFAMELRGKQVRSGSREIRVTAVRDISDRKRAEESANRLLDERTARLAAEEAARRVEIVSETSRVLAESLDYEETLRRVTRMVVPTLADWCVVYLVGEPGSAHRQAAAHVDPAKEALVGEMLQRYPPDYMSERHPVGRVIRGGTSQFVPEIPDSTLEVMAHDQRHLAMLRELGLRSYMLVPLVAHGEVLGAIGFVTAESGRRYVPADLALAEEIARRAAVAIDHARLYQTAVEANRVKADFLATMSHELRTPLNAMLGYSDLLLSGIPAPLGAGSEEYVRRIDRSARHLMQLIEEILSFSRLEAGRERLVIDSVEVDELVREVSAVAEPLASEKKLRYSTHAEEGLRLETDAGKLRQMLINLVGNAVKYTERGEVGLRAAADGEWVIFEVRDTGIGISETNLARIFEPFWQVESERTRRTGGTGLGLAVTQRLAELLGGDLRVQSEEGVGSSFVLRLPVRHEA